MAHALDQPEILARLRANIAHAGLVLDDADLVRIATSGAQTSMDTFESMVATVPSDTVPDQLKDWSNHQADDRPEARTASHAEAPTDAEDPLDPFAPLHVVAAAIANRAVSPVALTELMLERITRYDGELNAYQLVLADHALVAAREAEREIATGHYRGPIHGVPVAVKDLLAMAGFPTTAGSKMLAHWIPDEDAEAVRRLKEAGAIILGKTRLSEFAYSPDSNNVHYGPTRNPWNRERDTGGSSSGSAATVAAGLAYAALGSDTGCSIRTPSGLCGIVGLKPTHGRISLAGGIPLSWSLDHLGPMVRSVRDAALFLNLLAGYDPHDSRTRRGRIPDFTTGLENIEGIRGLRVGAVREDGSPNGLPEPEAAASWEAGLEALRGAGATIVDMALPDLQDLRIVGSAILNLEAMVYHEPTLRSRPQDYGPSVRDRLTLNYAFGSGAYVQAQQARAILRARLDQVWGKVDVLSLPALPHAAPPLGESVSNLRYSIPFNVLGWPAIVVPSGLTGDGLPLGTQIIGRPWDEATVLRAARAVERFGPWGGRHPAGFAR